MPWIPLMAVANVTSIHRLHIWGVSPNLGNALSALAESPTQSPPSTDVPFTNSVRIRSTSLVQLDDVAHCNDPLRERRIIGECAMQERLLSGGGQCPPSAGLSGRFCELAHYLLGKGDPHTTRKLLCTQIGREDYSTWQPQLRA